MAEYPVHGGARAELTGRGNQDRAVVNYHARWKAADQRKADKGVNSFLERIAKDRTICSAEPCVRGTKIWVSLTPDFPTKSVGEAELIAEDPELAHEDVLAAIAYAEAAPE
jgi:uncharacterized protein (DUF433 family)